MLDSYKKSSKQWSATFNKFAEGEFLRNMQCHYVGVRLRLRAAVHKGFDIYMLASAFVRYGPFYKAYMHAAAEL